VSIPIQINNTQDYNYSRLQIFSNPLTSDSDGDTVKDNREKEK
jgi:hypothetical protein